MVKLWGNAGEYGVPLPFLAGERRSHSLLWMDAENGLQSLDDSYLQHKQQKKMCVKYMI